MSTDTHADQAAGWPDDVPDTLAVADALGVEADQLVGFVDYHPSVSVAAVLGWALADPAEHEDTVDAWLEAHRQQRETGRATDHHTTGHVCGACGDPATAYLREIGFRCGDCHPGAPERPRDTPGDEGERA